MGGLWLEILAEDLIQILCTGELETTYQRMTPTSRPDQPSLFDSRIAHLPYPTYLYGSLVALTLYYLLFA